MEWTSGSLQALFRNTATTPMVESTTTANADTPENHGPTPGTYKAKMARTLQIQMMSPCLAWK